MARVTIEDCLENIDNRFALVLVAVQRARQLKDGAEPLVQHPKNKEPVVALREVAEKRVRSGTNLNELIGIPEDA